MAKALKKSSKRKEKHYDKFVKARKYKALFEAFSKKSKKMYDAERMENPQENIKKKKQKKTWETIKEIIGKAKSIHNDLPKRIVIDGIESFHQRQIANRK